MMGFLPTVAGKVVAGEVGFGAEPRGAKIAFERFFTSVDKSVFLHIRFLMEAFTAVGAGVWSGVGVDQEIGEGFFICDFLF